MRLCLLYHVCDSYPRTVIPHCPNPNVPPTCPRPHQRAPRAPRTCPYILYSPPLTSLGYTRSPYLLQIVRSFWQRHYYPSNATLYLVGDFARDDEALVQAIQSTFGRITPREGTLPRFTGRPVTPQHIARLQAAAANGGPAITDGWALQRKLSNADVNTQDVEFVRKMEQRDAERLRPPVDHQYGYGKLADWRVKYDGHTGCEVSLF